MFERFTDRARRVVVMAQEEARLLNHSHIGTEHVLLGLIHEGEGFAAQLLVSLGLSLDAVRHEVLEVVTKGEWTPSGHIPFTPRAKKVLELSLREALELGHDYIGTEHILLGLVREGEGVGAQVLAKLGVDLETTRLEVIRVLRAKDSLLVEPIEFIREGIQPARCAFCNTASPGCGRLFVHTGGALICEQCVADRDVD